MKLISLQESLRIVEEFASSLTPQTEVIPARWSHNRVTAAAVFARYSYPVHPQAAMDGIAVDCNSIAAMPARLGPEQWVRINTGEIVPERFNSVVKIEEVSWENEQPILRAPAAFFGNVRLPSEDFEAGSLLFPGGRRLGPSDVSLLIASGCEHVEVYRKPVVAFIPTGSELVINPEPGKIIESNSGIVSGQVEIWGGTVRVTEPVPDEADDIAQMLKFWSTRADIITISAGTSKGTRDNTAEVLRIAGAIFFHGVAITPGRPVLFGAIDKIPVLGIPGYAAACFISSYLYLKMLVCSLSKVSCPGTQRTYVSAEDLPARSTDTFHRVQCFDVDGQVFVRRNAKGSGSPFSLSEMDGILHVPPNTRVAKRDGLRVDIIRDRAQNTLTIRGPADSVINKGFDLFREAAPAQRLLYWEASSEDALQSIIERNLHVATINAPEGGIDPFPVFARQLQERMLRYRILTRTVALVCSDAGLRPARLAVPRKNRHLWQIYTARYPEASASEWPFTETPNNEAMLVHALQRGWCDAIFVDVRFVKGEGTLQRSVKESIDLVVPENSQDQPAVKKLVEIFMDESFGAWIDSMQGCDTTSRGLLEGIS